jgi:dTDP-4-dehydrorhamnose reductase
MARVAITGSNGFVGGNIAHVLKIAGHDVLGLVRSEPDRNMPWETIVANQSSVDSLSKALADCDAVVHCAIANDFNRLQQDRVFAYDCFVGLTQRMTRAANQVSAQMIYISTGWILDGTGHKVPELEIGNPVNFYGHLKSLGEQVIRDLAPESGVVARIEGVMGVHQTALETPRKQDVGFGYFVTHLVRELRLGNTFTVFGGVGVNKVTTPSLAAEVGAGIERIISRLACGTFHLVGDDAIERMEYARLVCEVFELNVSLLRESPPNEEDIFPGGVPVDTSLSNVLTKERLGLEKTSVRDLLSALRSEIDSGVITYINKPEVLL